MKTSTVEMSGLYLLNEYTYGNALYMIVHI